MIQIYKAERSIAGLADQIQANSSIAYNSQVLKHEPDEKDIQRWQTSIQAMANETYAGARGIDLYYTKSILVSTNWNKNDDVFSRGEAWQARYTPVNKPTNIEHDENLLVGHITESWAVDASGNMLNDGLSIDELPDYYHIVNGAVIYTRWSDEKLAARTNELITKIEAGNMYVSMECLFSNFDYALISPDGQNHVLARNEDTSYLTKHLRCYGGKGEYEGYQVGRLLKNITFSGKGYVENPANPESVIFNDATIFNFSNASAQNPFNGESGVLLLAEQSVPKPNKGETTMADSHVETQLAESKQAYTALAAEFKTLQEKAAKEGLQKLEETIAGLTADLEQAREEVTASKTEVKTSVEAHTALEAQVAELTEAKTKLETQISDAEAATKMANRVSELVSAGSDKADAEAKVELFKALSDEQWAAVSQEIIAAFPPKKDDDKKDDKKDKKKDDKSKGSDEESEEEDDAEANADEETLEDVKVEGDAVGSADPEGNDDGADQLRSEVGTAMAHFLGHKTEKSE